MKYENTLVELPAADVAVAGGGIAGTYAALGAAGEGASVALIETQSFLGGQATAGGVHTFCGETRVVNDDWRRMLARLRELGGIADYRPNSDGRRFEAEALKFVLQEMILAAGVRLYLHTQLVDTHMVGPRSIDAHPAGSGAYAHRRLSGLVLHNKSGLQHLPATQFIDATGDADIVARAGLAFEKGGPALKPGEELSVDTESGLRQLPMSLYFTLVDSGQVQEPVLPELCPTFKDDEDLPMITLSPNGRLMAVKMKVIGHDATDGSSLSSAEIEARRQMMGVIYHLQTKGYRGRTYETWRLGHSSPHIGIREGRRVVARHVISVDDVLRGRHHDDAVAVGSYHVDYHWPNVVQRAGTGVTTQCPPYQIPLGAMRPRDCDNLLVPGRCMSGEQMAMSSFRVMGTCAQTGFGAGVAAGIAVRGGQPLDQLDVSALQSRLRARGVRLDLAPYTSYLRFRRGIQEEIPGWPQTGFEGSANAAVKALAVAPLPSGTTIAAVAAVAAKEPGSAGAGSADTSSSDSGGADGKAGIWLFRRVEEKWHPGEQIASLPAANANGPSGWKLTLQIDDPWRLQSEGIEEIQETASPEPPGPPRVVLRLARTEANGSAEGGTLLQLETLDDSASWKQCSKAWGSDAGRQGRAAAEHAAITLAPGDGGSHLLVRTAESGVEVSSDDGATWRAVSGIGRGSRTRAAVSPAVASAADGLLVVSENEDGALMYRRIPIDVLPVTSEMEAEPMAGDWHHDDPSWIELLKQPAEGRL